MQIGAIAFSELPEITEVIIPAGITLISQRAFFECSKLRSAKIYVNGVDSVQVIGDSFPPGCIVTYARSPNSVTQGVQTSVNKIM